MTMHETPPGEDGPLHSHLIAIWYGQAAESFVVVSFDFFLIFNFVCIFILFC